MAKFLIQANYGAEGVRGLIKESASSRRSVVKESIKAIGGKMECMYYSFGDADAVIIADLPDNVAAAALSTAVAATGVVRIRTTPLLTVEEMDKAVSKKSKYKAPGK